MTTPQTISDDTLLWAVRERSRGQKLQLLAAYLGVTEVFLRVATNRVKTQDLASLPRAERPAAEAFYWRNGRGSR